MKRCFSGFTPLSFCSQKGKIWAGALVQWLSEMTHVLGVMGSNPCAVYWMVVTVFTLICCKKCIVYLKRLKINERETGVGPYKKGKILPNLETLRNFLSLCPSDVIKHNTQEVMYCNKSFPKFYIFLILSSETCFGGLTCVRLFGINAFITNQWL